MIRSSWIGIAAVAVMLATAPVFAQDAVDAKESTGPAAMKRGGDRGARPNMFKTAKELTGITEEQKQKLDKLEADFREKMKSAAKPGEPGQGPANRERLGGAWKESKDAIDAVLTAEQKKEFEAKLPKRPEGRPRAGQPAKPE